jgi:hypothetical protein
MLINGYRILALDDVNTKEVGCQAIVMDVPTLGAILVETERVEEDLISLAACRWTQ